MSIREFHVALAGLSTSSRFMQALSRRPDAAGRPVVQQGGPPGARELSGKDFLTEMKARFGA